MRKLISFVAAAAFAAVSFAAVAADVESKKEQKPAPTADAKKSGTATGAAKSDTATPKK
ncbi:MAG: hypothetical protein MUC55_06380 [Burkholderiales bacterium]|jgi:hypothetical protein|nr:hypothetical protein [Burkholderiales bacterium]